MSLSIGLLEQNFKCHLTTFRRKFFCVLGNVQDIGIQFGYRQDPRRGCLWQSKTIGWKIRCSRKLDDRYDSKNNFNRI